MGTVGSRELVREAFFAGLRKGWHGFLWMMKILVPVSLFTALLEWSGWIQHLDFLVKPIMALVNLPPMAALPLVIGGLTGIYGGIAAMSVLPFTMGQMTVMAIFLLICHNMIQETVIQGKSGINPLKAICFRVVAAIVTAIVVSRILDSSGSLTTPTEELAKTGESLLHMLQHWLVTTLHLALKIFCIILCLLSVMEVLKTLGWIERVVAACAPLFRIFGLSTQAGMIWLTALVFGLAYGAAIIVEEAKKGDLSREEMEGLHLSIGINHAVIEDPSLFLALGLEAFWLWVPRLVSAIVAVHLLRLWHRLSPFPRST
jgi:spore maturation protein SpmB